MNNFIGQWNLNDDFLCDEIKDWFTKRKKYASPGRLGNKNGEAILNKKYKDSLDISISIESVVNNYNNEFGVFQKYFQNLLLITDKYKEQYEYCDKYFSWGLVENFNIQYYKKRGGYKTFHCERYGATHKNNTRHLVWMTYLNDVEDEGETEFYYQKIKVKPQKGLTLIWPSDWTHTHRGIPSKTQEKYIITGWFNFLTE